MDNNNNNNNDNKIHSNLCCSTRYSLTISKFKWVLLWFLCLKSFLQIHTGVKPSTSQGSDVMFLQFAHAWSKPWQIPAAGAFLRKFLSTKPKTFHPHSPSSSLCHCLPPQQLQFWPLFHLKLLNYGPVGPHDPPGLWALPTAFGPPLHIVFGKVVPWGQK